MRALTFIVLAGCAEQRAWDSTHPLITIISIDRPIYRVTEDLLFEAESEAQATLFAQAEPGAEGYRIVQDTNFIAAKAKAQVWPLVGETVNQRVIVPEPGIAYQGHDGKWLSLPYEHLKLVLAHELGHAMGLVHVDHGLMESGNYDCLGTEAKCLVEALRDQGALK